MSENKETQGFVFAIKKITFLNVWIWSIIIGAGFTCGATLTISVFNLIGYVLRLIF